MKEIKLFPVLCSILLLAAGCKKSSNSPAAPTGPATSTEWTFSNTTYKGVPAHWVYDSTGMLGYLYTNDSTGMNELAVAFLTSGPSARPDPGKYYFVNSNGTNIPSGISPTQVCIMEAGPSSNLAFSVGGILADTAIVSFNAAKEMVVYFSNITVTGGIKVSGTLVE
jgi:hypothetical protein